MNIRVREVDGLKAAGEAISEADLTVIGGPLFAGRKVGADDVHVRQMLLCHDQYDRAYERFTKDYLTRFAETLPGKSVLAGHDYGSMSGSLPLGRFFRGDLDIRSEDFPVPVKGRRRPRWMDDGPREAPDGKAAVETVPCFEPQRLQVTYLRAGWFFPNDPTTDPLRKNIDLGVFKSVSIGFRYDILLCDICQDDYLGGDCPHILGWELANGKIVTGTYAGDTARVEAVEGSIVYLGCQPGARLEKAAREGSVDPTLWAQVRLGGETHEDPVLLKEAEALARAHGHQRKSWAFPKASLQPAENPPRGGDDTRKDTTMLEKLRKLFGLSDAATEDEILAVVERAKSGDTDDGKALKNQLESAQKLVKRVFDDLAKEYLEAVVKCGDSDTMPKLVVEMLSKDPSEANYGKLKELRDEQCAKVLDTLPAGTAGAQDSPGDAQATGSNSRRRQRETSLL